MKKTTDAISDTARKESVQVALLQTHGEDGAIFCEHHHLTRQYSQCELLRRILVQFKVNKFGTLTTRE